VETQVELNAVVFRHNTVDVHRKLVVDKPKELHDSTCQSKRAPSLEKKKFGVTPMG
jgi:hypothetical protein